jgi:hypothetical protein
MIQWRIFADQKGDVMSNGEYPMLLATINNSIGSKDKHFSINDLLQLFKKKDSHFTPSEKYMICAIQEEADEYEISSFKNKFHISQQMVDHVLSATPYQ